MATTDLPSGFFIQASKAERERLAALNAADKVRSKSRTLLTPDEAAGQYDVSRALMTMLGGTPRMLTQDDLRTFQQTVKAAQSKFRKGITAKGILGLSVPIPTTNKDATTDKHKAKTQIRTVTPIASRGGTVRFMTNAGPGSDRPRHYVIVEFLNFEAIAASAIPVINTGREMAQSPLKITCSCGRWRFWLAYLATFGGYNSGHPETAFPKVRNPGLIGVGCKHILRVASTLAGPSLNLYFQRMVMKARASTERKYAAVPVPVARKLAEALNRELSKSDRKLIATARQSQPKLPDTTARQTAAKNQAAFIQNTMKKYGVSRDVAEMLLRDAERLLGAKA
jgi:hypothetical protein